MANKIFDELHKATEILLSDCTKNIDNLSTEYNTIKSNLITVLKEINELRIKSITENYETGKNNNNRQGLL